MPFDDSRRAIEQRGRFAECLPKIIDPLLSGKPDAQNSDNAGVFQHATDGCQYLFYSIVSAIHIGTQPRLV